MRRTQGQPGGASRNGLAASESAGRSVGTTWARTAVGRTWSPWKNWGIKGRSAVERGHVAGRRPISRSVLDLGLELLELHGSKSTPVHE